MLMGFDGIHLKCHYNAISRAPQGRNDKNMPLKLKCDSIVKPNLIYLSRKRVSLPFPTLYLIDLCTIQGVHSNGTQASAVVRIRLEDG